MLTILPLFVFVTVFFDLVGLQQTQKLGLSGWRIALLQTAILLAVFIVLQSELLSLFRALNQAWVALLWATALLVSIGFGWKLELLPKGWLAFIKSLKSLSLLEMVFSAVLGVIIFLLFLIAFISIPNNLDSLGYHMSRVVHWAENQSLGHYPTGFEPQLLNPIGAEIVILNFRLLWGSDQLANCVQTISMVLSLVGVSVLAGLLGAGRRGQLAAVAFSASIPMGILQATSTQNDYVAALWLVCLAIFVVLAVQREVSRTELLCLAASLGLGLLTKGTFYPYALPLGVWLIIHWLSQRRFLVFLKRGVVIVVIVIMLNLGYWARNTITYGGPLGSPQWISGMTSGSRRPVPVLARLVENIAINYTSLDAAMTVRMVSFIKSVFMPIYPTIQGFKVASGWNHEDIAGNPLHMFLVPVTLIPLLVLARLRKIKDRSLLWYSLTVLASFGTLTLIVHFDTYGTRYQVPFFVCWAPVFGVVIAQLGERRLASTAAFLLLLAALPWVFFNATRPLIAITQTPEMFSIRPIGFLKKTYISSILITPPSTVLFANRQGLLGPHTHMIAAIQAAGCKNVGLRIDSHDIEYQFWWLLGAPQNGVRVETLYYSDNLARYADPAFKPCAIICTICQDRNHVNGLDLTSPYGSDAWLFLGNTYNPDPNQ
jgi:hypothetical protein